MTFESVREAKEYLIHEIVEQAKRENASLDDIERRLLYFTETGWMPEEARTGETDLTRIDDEYSDAEYEWRMAQKIRRLKQQPSFDPNAWNEAVAVLRREDHYLLVIIDVADNPEIPYRRPPNDFLKLIGTAFAIIIVVMVIMLSFIK